MTKKSLNLAIRAVIGLALIAGLILWIGPDAMLGEIKEFHPGFYAGALALLFTHLMLQAVIIKILLARHDQPARTGAIFRLSIIANFFGLFLPGAVGPDMVLCYNLCKTSDKKEAALSSILFIRIAVLFLMAILAFMASFHPWFADKGIRWITALILAAFAFYFFLMANRALMTRAERWLSALQRGRLTSLLYKTFFALSEVGRDRRALMMISPFLVGSAIVKIVVDYLIARSLGIDIPLVYFFALIPVITIVAAIPVTFAGLGIREASYVGLFGLAGVAAGQTLSVAVVSMSLVIVIAVCGAILYVMYGSSIKTSENIPAESGRPGGNQAVIDA